MTSDEFQYHEQTLRRVFGPTAVYVQVDNRFCKIRIVRPTSKLVVGAERRYEAAAERPEDSNLPTRPSSTTAFIERLSLLPRLCSYPWRCTPAPGASENPKEA